MIQNEIISSLEMGEIGGSGVKLAYILGGVKLGRGNPRAPLLYMKL